MGGGGGGLFFHDFATDICNFSNLRDPRIYFELHFVGWYFSFAIPFFYFSRELSFPGEIDLPVHHFFFIK